MRYPRQEDDTVATFNGTSNDSPDSCCGVTLKARESRRRVPTGIILVVNQKHYLTLDEARKIRDNLIAALNEADALI